MNENTDYFKTEELRSANIDTKVIPGGMLPNFGGDYMVRQFYIDTNYFEKWEYYDVLSPHNARQIICIML